MNRIVVNEVQITAHKIEVFYEAVGEIKKHFNPEVPSYWCEYSSLVDNVPVGIAVIPFVCNVLPLVWLTDAELIVPELDQDFYLSVSEFKKGYEEMYPKVTFAGKITVDTIVDYNNQEKSDKKSAVFFSGGVDATASLLAHIDEKPDLVTIWGADIRLDDEVGWENVQKHIQKVANSFGLKTLTIRSNFRRFIKPVFGVMSANWHDNYWYGLQHGIGIIGHVAPYAFVRNLSVAYIGSTNSPEYRLIHACASDPRIDNRVRFSGTEVRHDQAECTRQDKVEHIVSYISENHIELPLRVCWISSGGKNCCHCEKCFRTIMGLLACGVEPQKFGLNVGISDLMTIKSYLERNVWLSDGDITFWKEIQEKFIETKGQIPEIKELNWIYTYDFDKANCNFYKKILSLKRRIRKFLSIIKHEVIKH